MSDLRTIGVEGFPKVDPPAIGPAPVLQWVDIAHLVIDPAYQREIAGRGRRNVLRIAAEFDWSKFATVIVAPVEGGRYAIIDGQHRCTAAALVGVTSVPAQVVLVERGGQAAAFKAINGQVTKVTAVVMYKAAIAGGDPEALEIADVCERAGVKILGHVKKRAAMKAGETICPGPIGRMLKAYGRDHVITALQCVTETGDGNAGCLTSNVIRGFCLALHRLPEWRDAGGALLEAIDDFDIFSAADAGAAGHGANAFADAVVQHLRRRARSAA